MSSSLIKRGTAVKRMDAQTTFTPPLPVGDKETGGCRGVSVDSAHSDVLILEVQVKLVTFATHHFPPCLIFHAALWWSRNTMNYLFKEINDVRGNAVIKLHKCQETL